MGVNQPIINPKRVFGKTIACDNVLFGVDLKHYGPVVQWIGRNFAEVAMQVRFLPGSHGRASTRSLVSNNFFRGKIGIPLGIELVGFLETSHVRASTRSILNNFHWELFSML